MVTHSKWKTIEVYGHTGEICVKSQKLGEYSIVTDTGLISRLWSQTLEKDV